MLEAEKIPCYAEAVEEPWDDDDPSTRYRWRVLVPGKLNLRAASVIERDIDNASFEETWRSHLGVLSDEELRAARPEFVFCGLFDKVARVKRLYEDEIAQRRSDAKRA